MERMTPRSSLPGLLSDFARRFPFHERLRFDPVRFPRRYADPADREVVALVAALLAYGRVRSLLAKTEVVLSMMGPRPARWVRGSTPHATLRALAGWRHRWTDARDIACLVEGMRRVLAREGSLERAFKRGWSPRDRDLRPALTVFHRRLRAIDPAPVYGKRAGLRTLDFLLADPRRGSPLKRWNLFLRWMVRPDDGIDLGLWRGISPRALTIPLDTHVHRIAYALGLTGRTVARWATAREITEALARVDPRDPVRFDFALAHLGISGGCRGYKAAAVCGGCPLKPACALPARPFSAAAASGSPAAAKKACA